MTYILFEPDGAHTVIFLQRAGMGHPPVPRTLYTHTAKILKNRSVNHSSCALTHKCPTSYKKHTFSSFSYKVRYYLTDFNTWI